MVQVTERGGREDAAVDRCRNEAVEFYAYHGALIDWVSMTAAVGLCLCPSRSRSSISMTSWIVVTSWIVPNNSRARSVQNHQYTVRKGRKSFGNSFQRQSRSNRAR